jgi:peptidoglycan/xylan/chitin deacetylase (PgdA/CDA1 family)
MELRAGEALRGRSLQRSCRAASNHRREERDKPFAVVPYTLHMNDIVDYETRYFSTAMYADDLKAEFDALYAEAGTRRRMMSVSAHDRIAGRPSRAKVLEQFITYAQSHHGVAFMRKDEIARFALESPLTVREGT